MTHHDDSDVIAPIDTTGSDGPIDWREGRPLCPSTGQSLHIPGVALPADGWVVACPWCHGEHKVDPTRGALNLAMRTLSENLDGILDVIAPDGDAFVMDNGDIDWDGVWETLAAGYVHVADRSNVPSVPARVTTVAELDALPVGSVVRERPREGSLYEGRLVEVVSRGRHRRYKSPQGVSARYVGRFPMTVLHVPGRDLHAETRTLTERGVRAALRATGTPDDEPNTRGAVEFLAALGIGTAMPTCTFCQRQRDDLSVGSDGTTTACGDCRGEADR